MFLFIDLFRWYYYKIIKVPIIYFTLYYKIVKYYPNKTNVLKAPIKGRGEEFMLMHICFRVYMLALLNKS